MGFSFIRFLSLSPHLQMTVIQAGDTGPVVSVFVCVALSVNGLIESHPSSPTFFRPLRRPTTDAPRALSDRGVDGWWWIRETTCCRCLSHQSWWYINLSFVLCQTGPLLWWKVWYWWKHENIIRWPSFWKKCRAVWEGSNVSPHKAVNVSMIDRRILHVVVSIVALVVNLAQFKNPLAHSLLGEEVHDDVIV